MFFDPIYFLFLAPAILLGLWAQARTKSAFVQGSRVPARISGAQAARMVLDRHGLTHVGIEPVQGFLSDHYDSSAKVLRLSPDVYGGNSMSAVGIAAHEAGHALQDAHRYLPLVLRNIAVPAANFGSGISWILIILGMLIAKPLIWLGIIAFGCVVVFQLVNLPVEFDASARAKRELIAMGISSGADGVYVNKVLNAAAWTYVAATLQAVLTLAYFLFRFAGIGNDD
jgi:Zn-dependent membrane protease YugP